jgi:hypothetical protein
VPSAGFDSTVSLTGHGGLGNGSTHDLPICPNSDGSSGEHVTHQNAVGTHGERGTEDPEDILFLGSILKFSYPNRCEFIRIPQYVDVGTAQAQASRHVIRAPDSWETRVWPMGPIKRGKKWDFNGAQVDQGLCTSNDPFVWCACVFRSTGLAHVCSFAVYYWVKYVKKTVSFLTYKGAINWGERDGKVIALKRIRNPFDQYSKPRFQYKPSCNRFICDFVHFTRTSKPWIVSQPPLDNAFDLTNPEHLWWHTLLAVNKELGMGVDFSNWTVGQKPPLGYWAKD